MAETETDSLWLLDSDHHVDLDDPLDRGHRLNDGRVAWWLAVPGLEGGHAWYDLAGRHPLAFSGSPGWRSTSRPGGFSHVLFGGQPDAATAAFSAPLLPSTSFTLAASALTSPSMHGSLIKVGSIVDGFGLGVGQGTWDSPGNNLIALEEQILWVDSGVAVGTGWHRVALAYDGSTFRFYLDGVAVASVGVGTPHPPTTGIAVGGYTASDTSPRYFVGPVDDVAIWSRPLGKADIAADAELSARGYPGVLNRY